MSTKPNLRASFTSADNPRKALWAIAISFFMISVDSSVVFVANPSIMADLNTGYEMVIWVTTAYVLAYAVPSLLLGRLGDRFGVKNLYLIGLTVFIAASFWCGLSTSIAMLIAARVVQGVGAALVNTQVWSIIIRVFSPERRGMVTGICGGVAFVGTLVGPLVGGLLVDTLGWEWIFFANIPIGIIGLALAMLFVPVLRTHTRQYDLVGVALSGLGIFLIVFALQNGQSVDWAEWIWAMIVAGVGLVAAFVYWQSINKGEPLIPLEIFRDRDFATCSFGAAVITFVLTAMVVPGIFYLQAVCGVSPTHSALLVAPIPIAGGLLAPFAGRLVDRSRPRPVASFGFAVVAIALTWFSIEMAAAAPAWRCVLPATVLGVGIAFVWPTLAATAMRKLPERLAGAGSGVYATARSLGDVFGSAGMAAFMTSRIHAEMPPAQTHPAEEGSRHIALQLPEVLREPFAAAMSQSMLLPAFIALLGIGAAQFMVGFASKAPTHLEPADFDIAE